MRSATPGPWMVAGEDLPKCVVAASNPSVNLLVWNEHQETVEAASEADARLIAAAPDLAVGEIERLRAHNARMAAQINALADACDLARKADYEEEDAAEPLFEAMVGPKGGDWPEIRDALRRLAAGEVDDV